MKKLLLAGLLFLGSLVSAFATCTGPMVLHDFPGTTFNMSLATNAGDGNCSSNVTVISAPAITAASGAFASGAFASGSYASGAFASGSLASGSLVDITNMQTPIAPASATATKGLLIGGQYDSTQKTLTTGQQGAFSLSARGAMFVAVGADGFAVTNAGTFATQSAVTAVSGAIASGALVDLTNLSTPIAPAAATATKGILIGGQFDSTQKTLTNGQQAGVALSARGAQFVAVGADGFAVTNAGTFATQSAITAASGSIASGAVASGAYASGAVASGAYASGSLASGAVVDLTNLSTPIAPGTATATKGILLGGQYDSTQKTLTTGQQAAVSLSPRGAIYVATGADTFTVGLPTGASTSAAQTGVQTTVAAGTAPASANVGGLVYNSTAPAPTTGQTLAVQGTQSGDQRVFSGTTTATLSAWNSGTTVNTTQNIFTNSGARQVEVQLTQTTTITGGAITFEVTWDNGTTWVTIPAAAVLDPTSATFAQISLPYTLVASTNKQFLINNFGYDGLRIKLSTALTGTGAITPQYTLNDFVDVHPVIALSPTAANFLVTTTPPSNASTNISQVNGITVLTGTGAQGTGSQRVTVATDTATVAGSASIPAGTNLMGKVGIDQTTVGTTNAVSLAQVGANTVLTGNGVSGTGSQRVNIASDNTVLPAVGAGATGSAVPANASYAGGNASGNLTGQIICDKSAVYDASTTGSTQMVAISASTVIYVCGYSIGVGGTATNVKLVYGTGSNCATGSTNMTPAYQLAANGGVVDNRTYGNGLKTIAAQALCVNASAANAVQAIVYYTQF